MVTSSLPTNLFLLLFVLSCQTVQKSSAQSSNSPASENRFQYPSVDPAMAIIIVVLIAALFTVAFFSIYIRNRAAANSNTIRQTFSMRRRTAAATRGLENSVIETFPTFTHAEVKDHHIGKGALECAVCLNEFEDDQMLRLIPKCDHVFHPECIDAWLKSHVTCPVCRADLTPQPDEPALSQDPEVNREGQEQAETENLQQNNEVSIQIEGDKSLMLQQEEVSVRPEVKRNLSFNASNRPPRSFSIKRTRMFSKFRSHSTGHSLVVPGENLDRYTLRLPENVRKEVMNRALLNRTKSCAVTLPRHGSSTRGYRTGNGEGSNRGARSFRRIERFDQEAKSDRWVFKIVPPFFSRGSSMRSLKVRADNEEGSTSRSVKMAVKMPSFKCLEGDEPGLLAKDYLQLKEFKSVQ